MPTTTYNDTYITSAGKVERIIVTDTNDVNCNFISRTVTNRTLDTVDVDADHLTVLTSKGKDICLLENPTASEVYCKEWTVDATMKANGYVELDSGDSFMSTDDEMKKYGDVIVNGRYYMLNATSGRDEYNCNRATTPERLEFASGVLREGMKVFLRIRPK